MEDHQSSFPRLKKWAVVILLLSIALGAAFVQSSINRKKTVISTSDVIEQQIPNPSDQVLQQSIIGIDLETGWEATLTLNGIPIPDDQLTKTPQLGKTMFEPGPGKIIESLQHNKNCVTATFWHVSMSPEKAESASWCFTVL